LSIRRSPYEREGPSLSRREKQPLSGETGEGGTRCVNDEMVRVPLKRTTLYGPAAMQILGIETSCDETAVAIVGDGTPRIRANLVLSQLAEHQRYGGIVPEVAARAHLAHLDRLVDRALGEAGTGWDELHGVAATGGPGLIGGVMVGVMLAKSIA